MNNQLIKAAIAAVVFQASLASAQGGESLNKVVKVDIPAQKVPTALLALSQQAAVQVLMPGDLVDGPVSAGVSGEMTVQQAIAKLLKGTNLQFHEVGTNAIGIDAKETEASKGMLPTADAAYPKTERLAQVDKTAAAGPHTITGAQGQEIDDERTTIDEIIVTAQKRSEKLTEVPVSVTAIGGERLESLQIQTLSNLSGFVPGLTVSNQGHPGANNIVLRGITDLGGNGPLVGTYIDGVPVGSSTGTARGIALDLMPYDVERIEVLKGPQGTLYGSNTMGGLIKYTLRAPDLKEFEARVGADLQSIKGSDSVGWAVRGAVSVPLITDTLAMRLSAFENKTAGWINNIGTGTRDSNKIEQKGGRAVLLWQPSESLSVKASFLYQDDLVDDTSVIMINTATRKPIYGWNTKSTSFLEPYHQQTKNSALEVNWDLNFATLTSVTDFSRVNLNLDEDYPGLSQYFASRPDALGLYNLKDHISKFVEEARLASPEAQRFQWMVGGYFTREYGGEDSIFPFFTPERQPLNEFAIILKGKQGNYKEKAGFANVTYKLSDRFDVSAGARRSSYNQVTCPGTQTGGLELNGGLPQPCSTLPSQDVSTWMGNLRLHLTQDSILYARVATGYRPGTSQPYSFVANPPPNVEPDKTTNYEIGFKGDLLDRRIQITAAAFRVNWKDIQLQVYQAGTNLPYQGNGGTATSTGLELSATFQPTERLRIYSSLDYLDARLTEDVPGVGGKDGDQLPLSPHWTGSVTADYSQPIDATKTLTVGGAYRYRDAIVNALPKQIVGVGSEAMPPQNIIDLYAGIELNKVSLRLYCQNVFNNHSFGGAEFNADPNAFKWAPVQPRTLGLSADYRF